MARDTFADKMADAASGGGNGDDTELEDYCYRFIVRQRRQQAVSQKHVAEKVKENEAPEVRSFNFFDFPRELRDQIYEEALEYKKKYRSQHSARIRGRRVADVSLLLVSHQFQQEYMEQAERNTCLLIVDRDHFHGENLKLPTPIKYARKLELYVALACEYLLTSMHSAWWLTVQIGDEPDHIVGRCRILPELRMHRRWIVDLCHQMTHLQSVAIHVMIEPHAMIKDCEQNLLDQQYRFSNLEALTSVDVYHCDYFFGANAPTSNTTGATNTNTNAGVTTIANTDAGDKRCAWNFTKPRKLVIKLSPKSGSLERVSSKKDEAMEKATA